MNKEIFITVFTPTYNRGYILENLYHSLRKQTYYNFEWIILDDGSNDNTDKIVEKWLSEGKISIYYKKIKNGGKHRAINQAVNLAQGKMFFIVDSDDYLANDSLEKIIYFESTIQNGKYAGVAGNKGYINGEMIGKSFDGKYMDCTSLERNKYQILGDKAEVFYTEILKKFPFPEFDGEKFCTEAIVWNRIASLGYKIRWFNELIYLAEYRTDGLSTKGRKLYRENPKASYLYYKELSLYNKEIYEKLKNLSLAIIYVNKIGKGLKDLKNETSISYRLLFSALIMAIIRKMLNKC